MTIRKYKMMTLFVSNMKHNECMKKRNPFKTDIKNNKHEHKQTNIILYSKKYVFLYFDGQK